jgi:DNA mismatch repair ATPase MutS
MKDGGYIRKGFNAELDRLRELKKNAENVIHEIEVRERERTGIRTLKTGFNRVFGYYIEVSNSFKDQVPMDYIRKQTLTTGERYITEELKKFEEEVLTSGEKAGRFVATDIFRRKIRLTTAVMQTRENCRSRLSTKDTRPGKWKLWDSFPSAVRKTGRYGSGTHFGKKPGNSWMS